MRTVECLRGHGALRDASEKIEESIRRENTPTVLMRAVILWRKFRRCESKEDGGCLEGCQVRRELFNVYREELIRRAETLGGLKALREEAGFVSGVFGALEGSSMFSEDEIGSGSFPLLESGKGDGL